MWRRRHPEQAMDLGALGEALRAVEPSAALVSPWILRRVISHDRGVGGFFGGVPHAHLHVVSRARLAQLIDEEHIPLAMPGGNAPVVYLMARPAARWLASASPQEALGWLWRAMFHARVDEWFGGGSGRWSVVSGRWSVVSGQWPVAGGQEDPIQNPKSKIHNSPQSPVPSQQSAVELGPSEFNDVRAVLVRDKLVAASADAGEVWREFAATFLELHYFAPEHLQYVFAGIEDRAAALGLICERVNAAELLERSRPIGVEVPPPPRQPRASRRRTAFGRRRRIRGWRALLRIADRAAEGGNVVRSAILRMRVCQATGDSAGPVHQAVQRDVAALVRRLQEALGFDDGRAGEWRSVLMVVVERAAAGWWNVERRLLHDLQKVCVDHERKVYAIGLVEFLTSLGRRPLRRELPALRVVLLCKHLRSAQHRLVRARVSEEARRRLESLLHSAVELAETSVRRTLRAEVAQSLEEGGLGGGSGHGRVASPGAPGVISSTGIPACAPQSAVGSQQSAVGSQQSAVAALRSTPHVLRPPPGRSLTVAALTDTDPPSAGGGRRVYANKLVEELLDRIVRRGFLTMGDLRDAVARNPVKCDDLRGVGELLRGDQLLRTDRRLVDALDGIYRGGEVYLRFFQRLSSLLFANPVGRWLTRHAILPTAGAYLVLEALDHTVGAAVRKLGGLHFHMNHLTSWLLLSVFLLGVIAWPAFRRGSGRLWRGVARCVKATFVDMPRWMATRPWVMSVVRSRVTRSFVRYGVKPAVPALFAWPLLPRGLDASTRWSILAGVYVMANVMLNSRPGRWLEHATVHAAGVLWTRLTVDIVAGLFWLVVAAFTWMLDGLDRAIYAVDEWLRFRAGQRGFTLGVKAVVGVVWYFITYIARFIINLLVEPQINPIKHFPVVTVSHKLILPLAVPMGAGASPLGQMIMAVVPASAATANTIALGIVWGIPGIFGFLAWELKENWRQYAANRPTRLRPVMVGSHGETMRRLLRPGLHSGTIPKAFARLRKALRREGGRRAGTLARKQLEAMEHVREEVARFIERDLLALLNAHDLFAESRVLLDGVELSATRVRATLACPTVRGEPARIGIEHRDGRIIARIERVGWIERLGESRRALLDAAMLGFWKLAAVEEVEGGGSLRHVDVDWNQWMRMWDGDAAPNGIASGAQLAVSAGGACA